MKKDDLLLLGLYVLFLPVVFMVIGCMKKAEVKLKLEAMARVEKLYEAPVKNILIKNTTASIKIEVVDQLVNPNGFEFRGGLHISNVENFKISGDTLVIEGKLRNSSFWVMLQTTRDIKVDTVNAPNVNLVLPEILKDSIQDGL